MPRRAKDEERVEMILRGLLKQPDNRRCINCNTLGPQYVCTTFGTFVCTNCSGVHREFTHRVKSVSMAKFNDEEIMSLQAGGNERAKQIYFKNWDPELNSYPETNNLQRLRQFVNNVYIQKKYAGVNSSNKQQVAKPESKSSYCGSPSPSMSPQWGRMDDFLGRSPVERGSKDHEFSYDRSLFEKSSSSKGGKGLNLKDFLEERTPRNNQEMPRSSSQRSRSARFEIVDDRFREDGSVRRYERNSFRDTGSGGRSPSYSLRTASSLPIVRPPLNVILGDKSPDLRADDHKDDEGSARSQKAADEGSSESKKAANADDATKKEDEAKSSTSLIDFLESEAQVEERERPSESIATSTAEATAIVPINSFEALLLELSAPMPSSSSDHHSAPQMPSPEAAQNKMSPPPEKTEQNSTNASEVEAPEISNSCETLALTVIRNDQILEKEETNAAEIQTYQHMITLQSAASVESSLHEQGNRPSPAPDDLRRTKSVPVVQSTEAASPSQSSRKEIPEDLFTSAYPSFTPAVHPWHMPHGVGYNMQYHHHHHPHEHVLFQQPLAGYPNPSRPKNPFDIDDDRFQVQAPTFPSMSPLQGAYQHMPNPAASPPQPSPYVTHLPYPSHMNSYVMNMPLVPGPYMAQQSNEMLLPRPEESGNIGGIEDVFASLNPIARGSGSHSFASPPPPSRGGNPFG